jgi:two-component system, LytTR family, sensor kinase
LNTAWAAHGQTLAPRWRPWFAGRVTRHLPTFRWWQPLAYLALWTLVGLAFAGQHYLKAARLGDAVPWRVAIEGALTDWYLFAVLALPAFWLARRFNLGGRHWRLRLALHLIGGAVFSLLWILFRAVAEEWIVPLRGVERPFNEVLRYVLVATFFFNVLVYWVVVTAAHAVAYSHNLRERERRVLELENRLTTARLQALQMQLNPHFLFNALNGIGTLMYRDVDAADSMLVKLAELLRHALDRAHQPQVTLRDELAFLDRYLALEQMRFGQRLAVVREIAPETESALVPNLLLQPLVENAIKHGLEPQTRAGRITLRADLVDDERLRLEVEDDGRGLTPDFTPGIGTSNCRDRLAQLYGDDASFELRPADRGGVLARVEIPFREG